MRIRAARTDVAAYPIVAMAIFEFVLPAMGRGEAEDDLEDQAPAFSLLYEDAMIRLSLREWVMAKTSKPPKLIREVKITDPRIPKTEDELKEIVLETLHRRGFYWVRSVKLSLQPRRNPNWDILGWSGQEPDGFNLTTILKHMAILELRKKFAFKPTKPM